MKFKNFFRRKKEAEKADEGYELPLLRDEDIKFLRQKGDELFDFNKKVGGIAGRLLEAGDSMAIGIFTKQLSLYLSPMISDDYKVILYKVFDCLYADKPVESLSTMKSIEPIMWNSVKTDITKFWGFSSDEEYGGFITKNWLSILLDIVYSVINAYIVRKYD